MPFVFIELYSPKPSWMALSASAQEAYVEAVLGHVERANEAGVEILALGRNEPSTPRRSPHGYFCIYRLPDAEAAVQFEKQIEAAGWYGYFEQANVCGPTFEIEQFFRSHISDPERT